MADFHPETLEVAQAASEHGVHEDDRPPWLENALKRGGCTTVADILSAGPPTANTVQAVEKIATNGLLSTPAASQAAASWLERHDTRETPEPVMPTL